MQTKDFPAVQEARRAASAQLDFYRSMMQHKPHEQRVINEKKELDTKLEALNNFIDSDKFLELKLDEQNRLIDQCAYMSCYSDVLGERIECFDTTPN